MREEVVALCRPEEDGRKSPSRLFPSTIAPLLSKASPSPPYRTLISTETFTTPTQSRPSPVLTTTSSDEVPAMVGQQLPPLTKSPAVAEFPFHAIAASVPTSPSPKESNFTSPAMSRSGSVFGASGEADLAKHEVGSSSNSFGENRET